MNRRQAKKILKRDHGDDFMRALFGKAYAVFDDVRPMRRGRAKALAIWARDSKRKGRRFGRWWPATPKQRRRLRILREIARLEAQLASRIARADRVKALPRPPEVIVQMLEELVTKSARALEAARARNTP